MSGRRKRKGREGNDHGVREERKEEVGGGGEVEEEMLEKEKREKGKEKGERRIHNMNGSL